MFVKANNTGDSRGNADTSNLVADSQNVLKMKLTFPHIFQTNSNYTGAKEETFYSEVC